MLETLLTVLDLLIIVLLAGLMGITKNASQTPSQEQKKDYEERNYYLNDDDYDAFNNLFAEQFLQDEWNKLELPEWFNLEAGSLPISNMFDLESKIRSYISRNGITDEQIDELSAALKDFIPIYKDYFSGRKEQYSQAINKKDEALKRIGF